MLRFKHLTYIVCGARRKLFDSNQTPQWFAASFSLPHLYSSQKSSSQMAFTADVYNIKRGNYGVLNEDDLAHFKSIVGKTNIITDKDELMGPNTDWIKTVRGQSSLMLKPRTTDEVCAIMKHCDKRSLAVCPQGGNTGLVGGSVPVFDEVIISTQRMSDIISVDPLSGVMVCQAGCVLQAANEEANKHNLLVPLDLGAKGSCNLGGNVSTNAGGLRLLRYGSLRGSVVGIEAVGADGEVIDCLSSLRKDNTGYDIKQLMIGSEGTLGVVTKVAILCPPKPKSLNVAFLAVDDFEKLLTLINVARVHLGEIISAVEFLDSESMRLVTTHLGLTNPISSNNFYMLIETSGSDAVHDEEKMKNFLERIMDDGLVDDGTVASDYSKMYAIWDLRERIAEALLHDGYCFKYDMSFKTEQIYDLVLRMRERLGDKSKTVTGYGHLGDGNLHLNITFDKFSKEAFDLVEPFVFEQTKLLNGSISAEHGLGFKKRNYICYTKSQSVVDLMHKIKKVFDPKNILNPYKTLPDLKS